MKEGRGWRLASKSTVPVKQNGLKKKPSVPEFLEAKGLLGDALRIADKLLNSTPVA